MDLVKLASPLLLSMPLWVTAAVLLLSVGVVLYMRARGASLDEHVSISKATLTQMQTLVTLNENLTKQVAELQRKIEELENKIDELEKELKEARSV